MGFTSEQREIMAYLTSGAHVTVACSVTFEPAACTIAMFENLGIPTYAYAGDDQRYRESLNRSFTSKGFVVHVTAPKGQEDPEASKFQPLIWQQLWALSNPVPMLDFQSAPSKGEVVQALKCARRQWTSGDISRNIERVPYFASSNLRDLYDLLTPQQDPPPPVATIDPKGRVSPTSRHASVQQLRGLSSTSRRASLQSHGERRASLQPHGEGTAGRSSPTGRRGSGPMEGRRGSGPIEKRLSLTRQRTQSPVDGELSLSPRPTDEQGGRFRISNDPCMFSSEPLVLTEPPPIRPTTPRATASSPTRHGLRPSSPSPPRSPPRSASPDGTSAHGEHATLFDLSVGPINSADSPTWGISTAPNPTWAAPWRPTTPVSQQSLSAARPRSATRPRTPQAEVRWTLAPPSPRIVQAKIWGRAHGTGQVRRPLYAASTGRGDLGVTPDQGTMAQDETPEQNALSSEELAQRSVAAALAAWD